MSHLPQRLGALATAFVALLLLSPSVAALAGDDSISLESGTLAVRYITTSTPTLSGTSEPGARLDVRDGIDGPLVCSTPVGDDGRYSCTLTPLEDGPHDIVLLATDRAGNTSEPGIFPVIVDTLVPLAPMFTGPAPDTTAPSPQPALEGTGEPGASLTVVDQDGRTVLDTAVNDTGIWSGISETLPDGRSVLSATQTDPAGHVSPASDPLAYTVGESVPETDLAVTLNAPSGVAAGKEFIVHVRINNQGETPATQIQLESTVPAPFVLISISAPVSDLLPGKSQVIAVTLRADKVGNGELAWLASSAEREITPEDNTATTKVDAVAGEVPTDPKPEPEPVVTEPPVVKTPEDPTAIAASGPFPADSTPGRMLSPEMLASTGAEPVQLSLIVGSGIAILVGAATVLIARRLTAR